MEKRHQVRKEVSNLAVEISNGGSLYTGIVKNISYSGLLVEGVPQEVKHGGGVFNLTVLSNGENYQLRAIRALPRWVCENDRNKSVSLKIFSVPRNWFQFVDGL